MAVLMVVGASADRWRHGAAAVRHKEYAFIALTGRDIREDEASPADRMRMIRRAWRGR